MAVLALLLLVAAARPVVTMIDDPDFFWHLKTGEWIWQHGSLPQEFLFSLTAPPPLTDTERFTMTSYWAAQVLYHLLHALGGLTAIALLKCALAALLVGSLLLRRSGSDPVVFLGSALLGVLLLRLYAFERPQVFSFLFFSLLLLALDRLRSGTAVGRPWLALAPPAVMALWANTHGAYVIGQGTILLYLAAEGVKFASPALGPLPRDRYRLLLAAGAAGILAGFLNPNTWRALSVANLPRWMTAGNAEYQSTVAYFSAYNAPVMIVFWLLFALALLGFALNARRPDLTAILLVAGTGIVAFAQVRHVAFFVVAAVPALAGALSRGAPGWRGRLLVALPALAAGLYFLPADVRELRRYERAGAVNSLAYPVDAADFIAARGLRGDMYNYWPWGGYLLWRLAPARIFSDGRNSRQEVFEMNAAVERGNRALEAGRPRWKSVFAAYGVRYAVVPVFDPREGGVLDLLFSLATSADWVPAFVGVNSVVFVENPAGERRESHLSQAALQRFFGVLIQRCEELNRRYPAYPFPWIGRGDLLAWLRRPDEARAAYQSALRLVPLNRHARERLAALP